MPPRYFNLPPIQSSTPLCNGQSYLFHATRTLRVQVVADHYKTLELAPNTSLADIKKNFYALSKKHHPDHHPNDTQAVERFVKISEAYAILGNPSKREQYDLETPRTGSGPSQNTPRGSYSSSAPYGARPANGLSKRRTQFRGPPPSFYRNGAWGQHGARRQRQADSTASAHASAASDSAAAGASSGGGFGPAGSPDNLDHDVPHFDRQGHIRTQEQQDQRRVRRVGEEAIDYVHGGSVLLNFFFVSGILAVACLVPAVFTKRKNTRQSSNNTT